LKELRRTTKCFRIISILAKVWTKDLLNTSVDEPVHCGAVYRRRSLLPFWRIVLLAPCLAYSLTLNMETPHFSETLVNFCHTPQCHIPKDSTFWYRVCWSLIRGWSYPAPSWADQKQMQISTRWK
jgi:hypothetical protein